MTRWRSTDRLTLVIIMTSKKDAASSKQLIDFFFERPAPPMAALRFSPQLRYAAPNAFPAAFAHAPTLAAHRLGAAVI